MRTMPRDAAPAPLPGLPKAKIFMHGRSQAVRLPKEFRFEGSEVYVRRVGADVVLSSTPRAAMASLIAALDEFEPGFAIRRDQASRTDTREPLFAPSPARTKRK